MGAFPRRPMSAASLCILVANAAQPKNWLRFVIRAVVYFSPRLLCRFDLVVRAISIRRRIASDRDPVLLLLGPGSSQGERALPVSAI